MRRRVEALEALQKEDEQPEEALKKGLDLLSAVLNTAGALVVVLDPQGRIVRFNRACERTTGYSFEDVRDRRLWDILLLPEETEAVKNVFEELRAGQFPNEHENVWVAKDGARRVIAWSNTALVDAEGQVEYVIGTGLDITDRKRAEEAIRKAHDELEQRVQEQTAKLAAANAALKSEIAERAKAEQVIKEEQRLLRQMLDLHERERKLVSYEIHDGLAQLLTGALLNFQSFSQLRKQNPEEAQKLFERGHQLLSESIAEARRLIGGLRPPILDESGVVAAIDYLVFESRQRSGLEIEFSHHVDFDRLAPPLESALFRVAQETLTNAVRHSRSEKVRIELVQSGDRVRLAVRDWGIGFDPAKVGENCFGLRGIRERASLLGGNALIESPSDGGMRVVLELPLVQDAR